jgi:hypothetical protein
MGLPHDCEAPIAQSVDQPQPPQRMAPVKRQRQQLARQRSQLPGAARLLHADGLDVVGEVELRVVDPHRVVQAQGRGQRTAAKPRHQVEPRGYVLAEFLHCRGVAIGQQGPADVHGGRA